MYILQDTPDSSYTLDNGAVGMPVATLKDEHGGVSHITIDDGCVVLVNGSSDRPFRWTPHWYPEALYALQKLMSEGAFCQRGESIRFRDQAHGDLDGLR